MKRGIAVVVTASLACQSGAVAERDSAFAADTGGSSVSRVSVVRPATSLSCEEHEALIWYAGDTATAVIDGKRAVLRVLPGDGPTRYVSQEDSTTFLLRDDTTTTIHVRGRKLPACVEQSAAPFEARGHEPGWVLRIIADRITYIGNYGNDTVSTSVASVTTTGTATTYITPTETRLTVVVRDEPCSDGATGMPHPYSVTVTLGSDTVNGCGGEPSSLIVGEEWVVDSVGGRGMPQSPPTMTFSRAGRVSGTTSCNRYSGPYHLSGEGLTFGAMISTKMACAEPRMSQETAFLQLLGRVARFEITATGSLRLLADDGQAIIARRR